VRFLLLLVLHFLQQRGHAQQGNVDRCGVVSGPVPATCETAEPGSRIERFGVKGRRNILYPLPGAGLLSPRALALTFNLFVAPFQSSDWYIRLNRRGNAIPEQYFNEVREDTRRMTADSFTHMILENQRFRMPAGLDQVQVPALVVAGQRELAIMRRSARDLAATLPAGQGYLVAFSKRAAEEHAWNLHRPDLFNAVTLAWLTDQPLPAELISLR